MRLREILLERLTSIVYHATSYQRGLDILLNSSFKLSKITNSGVVHNKEEKKKYPYYLSLARTTSSGYVKERVGKNGAIVFELDGDMLSNNFKGKAVDWYGDMSYDEKRKDSLNMSMNRGEKESLDKDEFLRHFEHEDRLYSKKPYLLNFDKYIKAVHIENTPKKYGNSTIEGIKELKKKYPIYLYDDYKDMLLKKTSKAKRL